MLQLAVGALEKLRQAVAIAAFLAAFAALPAPAQAAGPWIPGVGEEVWGLGMGEGVIVAIIDARMHPREAGVRALPEIRLVERRRTGSHAARVAANLARRVGPRYGMAPGARILPIAVWQHEPPNPIADGVRWAVRAGAHVINISQLLYCGTTPGLPEALDAAERRGIPVVWSANALSHVDNQPDCLTWEQRSRLIVTTPAVGNRLGPRASRGGVTMLAAPGFSWGLDGHSFASFAAPVVSGTIALIRQARPRLRPAQIRRLLCATALRVRSIRCGILRPYRALQAIARPRTPIVRGAASRRGDVVNLRVRSAADGRLAVLAPRCRTVRRMSVRRGRAATLRLRCRGERRLRWRLVPDNRLRWRPVTGTATIR